MLNNNNRKLSAFVKAEDDARERMSQTSTLDDVPEKKNNRKNRVARIVAKSDAIGKTFTADDGEQIKKTTHKVKTRGLIWSHRVPVYDKVMGQTTYESKTYNEVPPFRTDKCKANEDGFTSDEVIEAIKLLKKSSDRYGARFDIIYIAEEDIALEEEMAEDQGLIAAINQRRQNVEAQDPLAIAMSDPLRQSEPLSVLPSPPAPPMPGTIKSGAFADVEGLPSHLQGIDADYV